MISPSHGRTSMLVLQGGNVVEVAADAERPPHAAGQDERRDARLGRESILGHLPADIHEIQSHVTAERVRVFVAPEGDAGYAIVEVDCQGFIRLLHDATPSVMVRSKMFFSCEMHRALLCSYA